MPIEHAGRSWQDKIDRIRGEIEKDDCEGLIVSHLDEICWTFNLRGRDVPFNPVFFAYCYITQSNIILFLRESQITKEIKLYLTGVELRPYEEISDFLQRQVKN